VTDDTTAPDGFVVTDLEEVAALVERDIPDADRPRVQVELDAVAPYVKDRNGPLIARIQLAMLFVAQVVDARELADMTTPDRSKSLCRLEHMAQEVSD